MRFWLDFKNDQKLQETLTQIDMHSAYFRLGQAVQIDLSLARPPQDVNRAGVNLGCLRLPALFSSICIATNLRQQEDR